jgi:hypothetical protein
MVGHAPLAWFRVASDNSVRFEDADCAERNDHLQLAPGIRETPRALLDLMRQLAERARKRATLPDLNQATHPGDAWV